MNREHQKRFISDAVETVFRLGKESAEKDRVIAEFEKERADTNAWKSDALRRLEKSEALLAQERERSISATGLAADLEKIVAEQERGIVERNNSIDKHFAAVAELETIVKSQREAIAKRNEEVKDLKAERATLVAQIKRHEDSIASLAAAILKASEDVKPIEAELRSLTLALESVQGEQNSLQESNKALQKSNKELEELAERRKETIRSHYEASIDKDKVITELRKSLTAIAQYSGDDYEKLISIASDALSRKD